MRPHPNPALLTVAEAAKVLGVSRQRVFALINKGALPVTKQHRHLFVPMQAVRERLIESRGDGDDGMMSVYEVAKAHGVTVKAVYRWHESGQLTGKLSATRRLRFDPQEVVDFKPSRLGRPRTPGP